jgi:methionyl aminopeptidase
MVIHLKSPKDIEHMRVSGRLVADIFRMLGEAIRPGVTLRELDTLAENYTRRHGAEPLYKGYRGSADSHPPFPGVICASVNDEICHGIPDETVLKEGDIVGIDIGLKYKGWCGDSCVTYPVGKISGQAQRLLDITQAALDVGIRAAQPGNDLSAIGNAIEDYARRQRVSVVKEWGGHGIGKKLHENPSVSHVRQTAKPVRLRPGMVFTIEPMVNLGAPDWRLLEDGWTIVTQDGALSAQFEHTVAITPKGPEILTKLN